MRYMHGFQKSENYVACIVGNVGVGFRGSSAESNGIIINLQHKPGVVHDSGGGFVVESNLRLENSRMEMFGRGN